MYLIVITATGMGPLPIISLVMLAVTYGLQVSTTEFRVYKCLTFVHVGYYFPTEAGVHVDWMDDYLRACVRTLPCSIKP